ncbi:MAG: PaaI family thioesterase [Desulfarculaceae bacterium]|nr:PaaI family thioesterase [Desulfarculaceae bacterium]MCF8072055.1 PaaI family thioesterase [Desulfarculaceae bacterium]MCF8101572.1 PaaI family thioesterase [Desulfarculaceae bacterium]MCF8115122.1 PaaI family thioesterase [Desulfarculaceae bacterium]
MGGTEQGGPRETPLISTYSRNDCFFCGEENPAGCQLRFSRVEGDPPELVCRWTPPQRFNGLGEILHGGIQSGIFDEIMGWTAHQMTGEPSVTGELHIEFLGPLYVGAPLEARCRVAEIEGRRVGLAAEIRGPNGQVASRAKGAYIMVTPERFAQVTKSEETVG